MQQQHFNANAAAQNFIAIANEFWCQLVEESSAYNNAQLVQIANAVTRIARKNKHLRTHALFAKSAALAYVQHAKNARIK